MKNFENEDYYITNEQFLQALSKKSKLFLLYLNYRVLEQKQRWWTWPIHISIIWSDIEQINIFRRDVNDAHQSARYRLQQ